MSLSPGVGNALAVLAAEGTDVEDVDTDTLASYVEEEYNNGGGGSIMDVVTDLIKGMGKEEFIR